MLDFQLFSMQGVMEAFIISSQVFASPLAIMYLLVQNDFCGETVIFGRNSRQFFA